MSSTLQLTLLFLVIAFFCTALFYGQVYQWESVWEYRALFFKGWLMTLKIAAISLALSTGMGILVMTMRRCSISFFNYLAVLYIEIIRGTPFLVQILFFFYVVAHAVGLDNRYVAGILILSLFQRSLYRRNHQIGYREYSLSPMAISPSLGTNHLADLSICHLSTDLSADSSPFDRTVCLHH